MNKIPSPGDYVRGQCEIHDHATAGCVSGGNIRALQVRDADGTVHVLRQHAIIHVLTERGYGECEQCHGPNALPVRVGKDALGVPRIPLLCQACHNTLVMAGAL